MTIVILIWCDRLGLTVSNVVHLNFILYEHLFQRFDSFPLTFKATAQVFSGDFFCSITKLITSIFEQIRTLILLWYVRLGVTVYNVTHLNFMTYAHSFQRFDSFSLTFKATVRVLSFNFFCLITLLIWQNFSNQNIWFCDYFHPWYDSLGSVQLSQIHLAFMT